jgi:HlyD family secretion protein
MQSQSGDDGTMETTTIGTGDIILTATGIGTLIPSEEVAFGFNNGGQVGEVYVSLGEHVEAGQVLARLESTTLDLKYKQAESNLAALTSPAEIAKAEQTVQDAKLSFAAARNDLQYLIGPDMLYAEEKVAEAQERLDVAKAAAEKDASDANKQNVLDAESALAKAQEALNYVYYAYSSDYTVNTFTYPIRNDNGITVRKELIAPTDAEVSAARAAYEFAKANLEDAQNYLDVLKGNKTPANVTASSITSLTEAELAYEQAKADLEAAKLKAPISGTITSINLNAGEDVGRSAVVTISNLDQPYVVETFLDETDWDKAKVGFAASVTFDLLTDKTYSGTITQVYPTLDDSSGISMVRILITLDDETTVDLPAGASASVDVTGGEALDAILVPISALHEMENGKYTVKVLKNGEFVEQEVEIGFQDTLYAEVKSGLQTGDVVLTDATINE